MKAKISTNLIPSGPYVFVHNDQSISRLSLMALTGVVRHSLPIGAGTVVNIAFRMRRIGAFIAIIHHNVSPQSKKTPPSCQDGQTKEGRIKYLLRGARHPWWSWRRSRRRSSSSSSATAIQPPSTSTTEGKRLVVPPIRHHSLVLTGIVSIGLLDTGHSAAGFGVVGLHVICGRGAEIISLSFAAKIIPK